MPALQNEFGDHPSNGGLRFAPARGTAAIRQSFRDQWNNPPPDLTLVLDRVDLDGPVVRAEWTCTSPAFTSPMRGYDLFTLNDAGQITRLEIIVTDAPPMDQ